MEYHPRILPIKILHNSCKLILAEKLSAISHLAERLPHSDVTIKAHIIRDMRMLKDLNILKFNGDPIAFLFRDTVMVEMAISDYAKRESIHKELFANFGLKSIEPLTEDTCIAFLKERGYKIMRPVAQFEEV